MAIKQIVAFETDDGATFFSKDDAEKHERILAVQEWLQTHIHSPNGDHEQWARFIADHFSELAELLDPPKKLAPVRLRKPSPRCRD